MTGWYAERMPDRSAKAMIAVALLALLLVAAVPVALLAAVVMMMLGYVVGGLALFGGSVLAAAIAVALAGMSGMRHLRKLLSGGSFRVVRTTRAAEVGFLAVDEVELEAPDGSMLRRSVVRHPGAVVAVPIDTR